MSNVVEQVVMDILWSNGQHMYWNDICVKLSSRDDIKKETYLCLLCGQFNFISAVDDIEAALGIVMVGIWNIEFSELTVEDILNAATTPQAPVNKYHCFAVETWIRKVQSVAEQLPAMRNIRNRYKKKSEEWKSKL